MLDRQAAGSKLLPLTLVLHPGCTKLAIEATAAGVLAQASWAPEQQRICRQGVRQPPAGLLRQQHADRDGAASIVGCGRRQVHPEQHCRRYFRACRPRHQRQGSSRQAAVGGSKSQPWDGWALGSRLQSTQCCSKGTWQLPTKCLHVHHPSPSSPEAALAPRTSARRKGCCASPASCAACSLPAVSSMETFQRGSRSCAIPAALAPAAAGAAAAATRGAPACRYLRPPLP